jgi:hypothetical protein
MTIYLHIGTEKTGTTYIQNFLRQNHDKLLEQGYFFPASPGMENHIRLTAYAQDDNTIDDLRFSLNVTRPDEVAAFRNKFKEQLLAETDQNRASNIIFSNEHCSSRLLTIEEISRLKDLLDLIDENIKIVVYLRRQDQFLLSTYSTLIKSGATSELSTPSPRFVQNRYDFAVLLGRWSEVFGASNLLVRAYDKKCFVKGDLLKDFAATLGVKFDEAFNEPPILNQSLDPEVLEFLRNLNFHLPGIMDEGGIRMRTLLSSFLTRISEKNNCTNEATTPDGFMKLFEESNQHVQNTYLADDCKSLFRVEGETNSDVEPVRLNQAQFARMAADLWLMAYEEILRLREQVQSLNK